MYVRRKLNALSWTGFQASHYLPEVMHWVSSSFPPTSVDPSSLMVYAAACLAVWNTCCWMLQMFIFFSSPWYELCGWLGVRSQLSIYLSSSSADLSTSLSFWSPNCCGNKAGRCFCATDCLMQLLLNVSTVLQLLLLIFLLPFHFNLKLLCEESRQVFLCHCCLTA